MWLGLSGRMGRLNVSLTLYRLTIPDRHSKFGNRFNKAEIAEYRNDQRKQGRIILERMAGYPAR